MVEKTQQHGPQIQVVGSSIRQSKWRSWLEEHKGHEIDTLIMQNPENGKLDFRNVALKTIHLFYADEPRDAFHLL